MGHADIETLGRYVVVRRAGRRDVLPGGIQRPVADAPVAHVRSYLVRTRDGEDRNLRQLHLLDPSPSSLAVVRRGVERYRALRHPALSALLDCFELDGQLALVFAREEGVGLDRLKGYLDRDRERLPDAAVWFVGWQLAGALAVCHLARDDAGALAPLVHGALTMQDVLISWDGGVRVEGLCPFLGAPPGGQGGREAAPSRAWLAPEVRRGDPPNPRSDVYAVALILRALLSGRPPPSAGAIVEGIADLRPDIPSDVADALDRALDDAAPHARPSAGEISQRLEGLVRVTEGRRALNDCMELYQALWGLWSVAAPDHWSHDELGEGDDSGDDRHTFPGPEPKMLPRPTPSDAIEAEAAPLADGEAEAEPQPRVAEEPAAEEGTEKQEADEQDADELGRGDEGADDEDASPRTSRSPGTDAPPSSTPGGDVAAEAGPADVVSVEVAAADTSQNDVAAARGPASSPAVEQARSPDRGESATRRARAGGEPSKVDAAGQSSNAWLITAVAVVAALLVWYVLGDEAPQPDVEPSARQVAATGSATPSTAPQPSSRPPPTPPPPASAPATAAPSAAPSSSAPVEPDVVDQPLSFDEGLLRIDSKTQAVVFVNGVAVGPTNKTNKVRCGQRFVRLGVELGKWVNTGRSIPLACGEVTRQSMEADPP